MALMSITCRNVCWCAVTTITERHLIQRVIPLTLIGKIDDGLAIRAPIAPPDNASRNGHVELVINVSTTSVLAG